jgi:hypothetical protein
MNIIALIKNSDYDLVNRYLRATGMPKHEFLTKALMWQLKNTDVPFSISTSRTRVYRLLEEPDELVCVLRELSDKYDGVHSDSKLCLQALHNYTLFCHNNGMFRLNYEDVKEMKRNFTIMLSQEVQEWMKEKHGTYSNAVRQCVDIAYLDGSLPPLSGRSGVAGDGSRQVAVHLTPETREKIKQLIVRNGGSVNAVVKQCILLARSVDELF